MTFQSQKSPQTQTDVILPLTAAAALRSFNQTLLFDAAMKMFNLPTVTGIFDALQIAYFDLRTRLVLRRAVRGNVAKHFAETETFKPDHVPVFANLDFRNCTESFSVGVDLPVRFQPGQKTPAEGVHQFQIPNQGIPTIKTNHSWSKAAFVRFDQHLREMVVLGFTIRVFIKNSIITRHGAPPVRPEQSYQVDAADHFLVFARPMPVNQSVAPRERFIERPTRPAREYRPASQSVFRLPARAFPGRVRGVQASV